MNADSEPGEEIVAVGNGQAIAAPTVVHFRNPADALSAEHDVIERFNDPARRFHIGFWSTQQCLVAPRSLLSKSGLAAAQERSAASGWPVFFRRTGGDVTPQGAGILNVVVAFAPDACERPSIAGVYRMFCAPLLSLFGDYAVDVKTGFVADCFCDGEYNIVVGGLKVAGTAQRWTRVRADGPRQIVFAHALVLIDAPVVKGVSAINRLNRDCEIDRCVRPEVHTSLQALVPPDREAPDIERIVRRLHTLYCDELIALTR